MSDADLTAAFAGDSTPNVLHALMMREVITRFGRENLGCCG